MARGYPITVRATNSHDGTFDKDFFITVTDVAETPPDNPPPDDGDVEDDGSFTIVPVVTVVDGGIKISGKKNSLVAGKFIYDLGAAEAGQTFTISYDPDFTLLTNQGKNAAIGFVFKHANDFHFVTNQGDGSTGLNAAQVSGDDLWNAGAGWTEDDAGAVANGTQAGPNFIQIEISDDGSTYTYRTGPDADGPWTDEYTDEIPTPHADCTTPSQFGIGAVFRSNDTGSFSIKITHYVVTQFTPRQVAVASVTSAGFLSVDMRSARQAMLPGVMIDSNQD